MIYRCTRGPRTQILAIADLETADGVDLLRYMMPDQCRAVYAAPPWSTASATNWRVLAGDPRGGQYPLLVRQMVSVMRAAVERGAADVLLEVDPSAADQIEATMVESGWPVPRQALYDVYYGTPGRASRRSTSLLLHYGARPLATDPSLLRSEAMVIRAFAGLRLAPGDVVVDPFIGIGMASRVAHYFDCDAVGTDLNPKRLAVTARWLETQGYTVSPETR